eukprot:TRINITY_DN6943_c0_g1_i2.p1 TRINITY_DN6943_c0_g1~~TRINITY_DN6943_c0_g1_i2.p1  ORF type:complete len:106 (+),score=14.26 TRINITY_DN6943_c0_g1_i2:169-486(+)
MSDTTERKLRATISAKLQESGERERLKEFLRAKLVECGWRDDMKNYSREIIKQRGLENITVEDLIQEISPHGKSTLPPSIKADLLQRIRKFLSVTTQGVQHHPTV